MPCSATFNLHPLYLCSYPVFVCSGESYLCKIGRQYFSRQQRQITPEVPSDSLRFLEDRQQAWFKLKKSEKLCKTLCVEFMFALCLKSSFFRHLIPTASSETFLAHVPKNDLKNFINMSCFVSNCTFD